MKIVVEDTGIGIKQKNIGKIFKMFQLIENQKGNKSGRNAAFGSETSHKPILIGGGYVCT